MFSLGDVANVSLLKHCGFYGVSLAAQTIFNRKAQSGSFLPSAGTGVVKLFCELDSI